MKSGERDVRKVVANDRAKVKVKNKMADAKRSQNQVIPEKINFDQNQKGVLKSGIKARKVIKRLK